MDTKNKLFVLSKPTSRLTNWRLPPDTFYEVLNTCERQNTHLVRSRQGGKTFWASQDLFCEVEPTITETEPVANIEDAFTTEESDLAFQEAEDQEPRHRSGCVCADCSGAELTAEND